MARRSSPGGRRLRSLAHDTGGVAIIEAAIVLPVFLILTMGIYDIGHMAYAKSTLNGAVQQAARSSSLESADTAKADERVEAIVAPVVPGATFESERKNYFDFDDIGRPEKFNDQNVNGTCDNGENYVDENDSGAWEDDVGSAGNGGSGDVVVYTVKMTYKPLFPIPWNAEMHRERTLTSTTVKKNQPFGNQEEYGQKAGTCS